MNKEFIAEWVAELRSGNRKQTTGRLHRLLDDGTEAFCCLGVAQDMLAKREVCVPEMDPDLNCNWVTYDGEAGVLSQRARNFIGFSESNPDVEIDEGEVLSLAALNDNGYTFEQIADLIESNFLKEN